MNTESISNSQSGTTIANILNGNIRFKESKDNETSKPKVTTKKSDEASKQVTTLSEIFSGVTLIHVNNVRNLQKLITLLEGALAQAKKSDAQVQPVIEFIKDGIENILNPHKALENELAQLVEAKMPPNSEVYNRRADKSELAVAFFRRVYGRFYDAGVLYSHQLRALDANLLNLLNQYKGSVDLPTKRAFNDRIASQIGVSLPQAARATSAVLRRTA